MKLARLYAAIAAALVPSLLSPAAHAAKQYTYTVYTVANAARQGSVNARGITWRCAGNRCTVTGPWPMPGVSACANLAKVVGRVRSYGHTYRSGRYAASLSGKQLESCNAGVTVAGSPIANRPGSLTSGTTASKAKSRTSVPATGAAPPAGSAGRVQNPGLTGRFAQAQEGQQRADQRFLRARDRLRRGPVDVDGGHIVVTLD